MPTALVLMATYNGGIHLREQLDSIVSQKGIDIELLIHDDCSADDTVYICKRYRDYGYSVNVIQNECNLGSNRNFMNMIYEVDADKYDIYAFSDQDDVWMPDKLQRAYEVIEQHVESCEGESNSYLPILYYSDLINADENLENRRRELKNLRVDYSLRATPIIRNYVSGCTIVMNGPMVKLLQKAPQTTFATFHDAWCFQVAFYCGHVIADVDTALIVRRLGKSNQSGEQTPNMDIKRASIGNLFKQAPRNECQEAARCLLRGYKSYMNEHDCKMIESLSTYRESIRGRIHWALSREYKCMSFLDTQLIRVKFLLGRL